MGKDIQINNRYSDSKNNSEIEMVTNHIINLLDIVNEAFISFDNQWNYIYINHAAEGLISKPKEELIGNCLWDVFPNLINSKFYLQLHSSLSEQKNISIEEFINSSRKWLRIDCYPSKQGLSINIKDITEQKTSEQLLKSELKKQINELKVEKNMFISLLTNAPAFIAVLEGSEHIFKLANPMCKLIFGNRELVGKSIREAIPEVQGQGYFELLDNVYKSGEPFFGNEIPAQLDKNNDGNLQNFYFNFVFQPIFNIENKVEGVSIFAFDVTDQVISRKKAEDLNTKIEMSNDSLKNFAHVASHDLQEPLRMVSSYTQLLAKRYKDNIDKDSTEFINFILDGTKSMQTMIKDILNHAEIIENIKDDIPIDLNKTIENIKNNLKLMINEHKVTLNCPNLPTIKSDPTYMIQLFQNLISNAIKYRKKDLAPVINISVEEKENLWFFAISDNGIGINREYFDKIFVIFQRLHGKSEYEGTGIGLSNCKKIVELYHGEIWVDSQEGKGSTFYFTLPKF